jgi:hypothetical protein
MIYRIRLDESLTQMLDSVRYGSENVVSVYRSQIQNSLPRSRLGIIHGAPWRQFPEGMAVDYHSRLEVIVPQSDPLVVPHVPVGRIAI